MKDITGAKLVEVSFSEDRRRLWVNVEGECVLRICQIEALDVFPQLAPHLTEAGDGSEGE